MAAGGAHEQGVGAVGSGGHRSHGSSRSGSARAKVRTLGSAMIDLDAASFLLQWAVGGLFFTWVTTRRREVGLGYGWMMRGVFATFALASIVLGQVIGPVPV